LQETVSFVKIDPNLKSLGHDGAQVPAYKVAYVDQATEALDALLLLVLLSAYIVRERQPQIRKKAQP